MERSYSGWLRRWKPRCPTLFSFSAASSIFPSSRSTRASNVSGPGRGIPGGGIIPARSFAIIFSAVSGRAAAAATSNS